MEDPKQLDQVSLWERNKTKPPSCQFSFSASSSVVLLTRGEHKVQSSFDVVLKEPGVRPTAVGLCSAAPIPM